jgi:hypothetical protein
MLDIGFGIRDMGYWILDAGYWILDTGYWTIKLHQIVDMQQFIR